MATTKPRATQIRGLAKQQAPYLFNIIPDSYLPDSTGDVDVYGEFFTPDMTVSADGQTVNYFTFINSGHIKVNMTRGSAEGTFGLTLDNGIEAYFPDVMLVVLGEVFKPETNDWSIISGVPDISQSGSVKITNFGSQVYVDWNKVIDFTKDFSVRINIEKSPLGTYSAEFGVNRVFFELKKISDNTPVIQLATRTDQANLLRLIAITPMDGSQYVITSLPVSELGLSDDLDYYSNNFFEIKYINSVLHFYFDDTLKYTFTQAVPENLKLAVTLNRYNAKNIKYIELAT